MTVKKRNVLASKYMSQVSRDIFEPLGYDCAEPVNIQIPIPRSLYYQIQIHVLRNRMRIATFLTEILISAIKTHSIDKIVISNIADPSPGPSIVSS